MKFKNILLALTVCIIALGCKKQDLLIYDSEIAGVYFQGKPNDTYYTDSSHFAFAAAPASTKDTILMAPVLTMGKLRDYARPFKVSVDQAKSTAIEGKHFEIDLSSAVVPAGAAEGYVRVKFKRTDDMLKQTFRLVLKLEDNEHFKAYMEKQVHHIGKGSINSPRINADRWLFKVDDIISRPRSWPFFGEFWGTPWSAKKYAFINSVTGWTHYDWTIGYEAKLPPIEYRYMSAAAVRVRDSLQVLKNAGTPLLDENGTPMQLSSQFLVR